MNLKNLNNQQLENSLTHWVGNERKALHMVLRHLREVLNRRLYLDKPRPNLKDYLVNDMGYSSTAADRRIAAVALMKDIPELANKIQEGSVNLSQAVELKRAIRQKESESDVKITASEKIDLLGKIEHQSGCTTQKILAQELDIKLKPPEVQRVQKDESIYIQTCFSKERYAKFEICKNLSAHVLLKKKMPIDFASVVEVLMDEYIERHTADKSRIKKPKNTANSPKVKKSAHSKNVMNREEAPVDGTNVEGTVVEEFSSERENSKPTLDPQLNGKTAAVLVRVTKTLTAKTRRFVLARDKCCQYANPQTQEKCGSFFALEVDHKIPLWADGDHDLNNLTTL